MIDVRQILFSFLYTTNKNRMRTHTRMQIYKENRVLKLKSEMSAEKLFLVECHRNK